MEGHASIKFRAPHKPYTGTDNRFVIDRTQSTMRRTLALLTATTLLTACSGLPKPPPGPETERSFTVQIPGDYQDAYRAIARLSTTCFGQSGLRSINYSVQSDLDAVAKVGRVEVYPSGIFNTTDQDAERKSYITTITSGSGGTEITTTGPTRNGAFVVHRLNQQWVAGDASCALR